MSTRARSLHNQATLLSERHVGWIWFGGIALSDILATALLVTSVLDKSTLNFKGLRVREIISKVTHTAFQTNLVAVAFSIVTLITYIGLTEERWVITFCWVRFYLFI